KCHLGPDHPQKEIYEESKHGVAYRDLKDHMNLNSKEWVLGKDYTQAPTCATCHMSGNTQNDGKITHDPGRRISWTNRPPISQVMDTDLNGKVVTETDPAKRQSLVAHSWEDKRNEMKQVCSHCHTPNYVNAFHKQYDDFVVNYNEKFAKPGKKIMDLLAAQSLLTKTQFDEEIEWTWFYLWHHEGRRARHGASMMAPDYAHWHGMYEVAERFYMELIPMAREITHHARENGQADAAAQVDELIDSILARPEHEWFEKQKKLADDAAANTTAAVAVPVSQPPVEPPLDTPAGSSPEEASTGNENSAANESSAGNGAEQPDSNSLRDDSPRENSLRNGAPAGNGNDV
ncbi:MAG: hypothetical protein KDA60_16530, partial [Planctomycetales bacterium]|nr:hypothetical protein [Planctomycetales bacterium]